MRFSWEGLLNFDKRQQIIAKTIILIYVCLHCSKSRAFTTALKLFADLQGSICYKDPQNS